MAVRDATKIVGDPKDDTPAEGVTPEQQIEDSEKLVDKVLDQLKGHALQKGAAQRLINTIRSDHKI